MSNLEELIERLCPDGVEYKTLGDVATISRGGNFQKKDFTEQGKPCIHYGQIYTRYGLFTDKTLTFINDECFAKQKYAEPNDIIMAVTSENIEDICKCVAWLGTEKVAVSGHSAIIHHSLDPKYLAYFFHSQHFFNQKRRLAHGTKVMEVTPDTLKSIQLPVPPLEVQREIVRILDNFTFLTAELAAELAARQKQYEYYKVNLLLENNQSPNVTLNDIAINRDSQRKPVTSSKRESGNIPYYGASGIVDYVKDYIFDGDYLLVSEDGANLLARNTPIAFSIQGKTWVNNHAHILEFNNYYTRRYVEFYLNSIDLTPYISGGAQPKLNQKNLNSIKIPLPVLQEQQRIVGVLDRFDSLCNDISSGLPAEIEARQKQYEYYRDKLLSFKELKKEA